MIQYLQINYVFQRTEKISEFCKYLYLLLRGEYWNESKLKFWNIWEDCFFLVNEHLTVGDFVSFYLSKHSREDPAYENPYKCCKNSLNAAPPTPTHTVTPAAALIKKKKCQQASMCGNFFKKGKTSERCKLVLFISLTLIH